MCEAQTPDKDIVMEKPNERVCRSICTRLPNFMGEVFLGVPEHSIVF